MKKSPLAPGEYAKLPPISGIGMASCEAGIRYAGRKDLLLVRLPEGTTVAGTLTQSKTRSAAVEWCAEKLAIGLEGGKAVGLVVNSGNANAFTGMKGRKTVELTAAETARVLECKEDEVFLASTGVIGEAMSVEGFNANLADLADYANRDAQATDWHSAAEAIMTTDTFPKLATRQIKSKNAAISINGIAKGSGMIAPDMATMLAFVFTDADIPADALQALVSQHVESTFNAVTVDGDTSTSDTLLVFATGQKKLAEADQPFFEDALHDVLQDLALQIVRDGEGASKLAEIIVTGAESDEAAKKVAFAIGNSPLVKTALAGEDPNWGRVVMAVGKSGEMADRDLLSIWFGDILVADKGEVHPDYKEEDGAAYMKNAEIEMRVDLGIGKGKNRIWTCDLTKEYISINADYRS